MGLGVHGAAVGIQGGNALAHGHALALPAGDAQCAAALAGQQLLLAHHIAGNGGFVVGLVKVGCGGVVGGGDVAADLVEDIGGDHGQQQHQDQGGGGGWAGFLGFACLFHGVPLLHPRRAAGGAYAPPFRSMGRMGMMVEIACL